MLYVYCCIIIDKIPACIYKLCWKSTSMKVFPKLRYTSAAIQLEMNLWFDNVSLQDIVLSNVGAVVVYCCCLRWVTSASLKMPLIENPSSIKVQQ